MRFRAHVVALALVVAGLAGLGAGPAELAEAHHGPRCGDINIDSKKANARFIRCVARHAGSPGGPDIAVAIGRCETRLEWWLIDENHGGTFQQDRDFWPGRVRTHLPPRSAKRVLAKKHDGVTDPKANARVSVRMAAADGTWRNHWRQCSSLVGAP